MGNTPSLQDLSSSAVAGLLMRESPLYQQFAEKLFHADEFLSLVDGNFLLSLELDKPKDTEAFESILDTIGVHPPFVRKSLENLLRMMQQRSFALVVAAAEQELQSQDLQPPTSTNATPSTEPTAEATTCTHQSAPAPDNRGFEDMATSTKHNTNKKEPTKKPQTNQVDLFLAAGHDYGTSRKVGQVSLVDPTPQALQLWNDFAQITLEDYTTDPWARNVETNAAIEATSQRGTEEIASLVRMLGGSRKSVYGRFRVSGPEAATGVVVIPYLQSMKNKKGRVECRIEKNIRNIQDCPLKPLSWATIASLPTAASASSVIKFKSFSDAARSSPAAKLTSLSAAARRTKPWNTSLSVAARAGSLQITKRTSLSATAPIFQPQISASSPSRAAAMSWPRASPDLPPAQSWTPVRVKKSKADAASPTTVMNAPGNSSLDRRPNLNEAGNRSELYVEAMKSSFRRLLEAKLEKAFGDHSSNEDQRDFLGAMDVWDEWTGQEQPLRRSYQTLKEAFVPIMKEAVLSYNERNNKKLVVRYTDSMHLWRVSVFKNKGVLKRVVNGRKKTKLCHYWVTEGSCVEGDKCNFAHGEHELVGREGTKGPSAEELNGQAKMTAQEEDHLKCEVVDSPFDEVEEDKRAALVGFVGTGVDSGETAVSLEGLHEVTPVGDSPAPEVTKNHKVSEADKDECVPESIAATESEKSGAPVGSPVFVDSPTSDVATAGASAEVVAAVAVPTIEKASATVVEETKEDAFVSATVGVASGDETALEAKPVTQEIVEENTLDPEEEAFKFKFRQLLWARLEKAFGDHSPNEHQRHFLEVMEVWDEWKEQEETSGGASYKLKQAFVPVVKEAVRSYNAENDKELAVRGTESPRLSKITIFKNEDVLKRIISERGKTKICRFWMIGACAKGDRCTFALGLNDIVRDSSPEHNVGDPQQSSHIEVLEPTEELKVREVDQDAAPGPQDGSVTEQHVKAEGLEEWNEANGVASTGEGTAPAAECPKKLKALEEAASVSKNQAVFLNDCPPTAESSGIIEATTLHPEANESTFEPTSTFSKTAEKAIDDSDLLLDPTEHYDKESPELETASTSEATSALNTAIEDEKKDEETMAPVCGSTEEQSKSLADNDGLLVESSNDAMELPKKSWADLCDDYSDDEDIGQDE